MTEMAVLRDKLIENNIPFEERELFEGEQIIYPNFNTPVCSVICHKYSYGFEHGLLEIAGLVPYEESEEGVKGFLTATEVFNRINNFHNNN